MAVDDWTAPTTRATNDVITAAIWNADVVNDLTAIFNGLVGDASADALMLHRHKSGTFAALPAAGNASRLYWATDTLELYLDDGTNWVLIGPKLVRKTANQSVTASTTLVNDTHLKFAIRANEEWAFEVFLIVGGPTAGDIKIAFTVPAAATLAWGGIGLDLAAASNTDVQVLNIQTTSGGAWGLGLQGVVTSVSIKLWGTVANGANAGDLQMQWAQNTSDGSATTVGVNSWLKGQRTV